MILIPTYIINLSKRTDRKMHILEQFNDKPEFNLQIVQAVQNEIGAIGLWKTIKHILQNLLNETDQFVLICEDDHLFNNNYSKEILFKSIKAALANNADILSGGVSWLNSALQVSENIYWVEKFTGLQFTVFFRKFFSKLIAAEFEVTDVADFKISSLTNKKFFIHPFISVQKEFGYSDVTSKNNMEGRVENLFKESSASVQIIKTVSEYFARREECIIEDIESASFENIIIPTYVVCLAEGIERIRDIKNQFFGKSEFDVNIVDANLSTTINKGFNLWPTIRKIIEMAIENDEDAIIICQDTHEFTPHYSKQFLLQNIISAYQQGADLLLGGISDFGVTVPITNDRLWLGSFSGTPFLILYKPIFSKILNETIDETKTIDDILSELTSNKMVLCPFISLQKDLNNSSVKLITDNREKLKANPFIKSERRLDAIQKAYSHYSQWSQKDTINKS